MRPKLTKKTSETTVFTVDFTELLGSATVQTINHVTASGVTVTSPTIVATAINTLTGYVPTDYVSRRFPDRDDVKTVLTIGVGKGIQFTVAGGLNSTEYMINISITTTDAVTIVVNVILIISNIDTDIVDGVHLTTLNYYGSVLFAQDYFIGNTVWPTYNAQQQLAALVKASAAIDNLNYTGIKTIKVQPMEFPRDFDIDTPVNIDYAAYEEALLLIQGVDPNEEQMDLSILSEGIGSARVTYDRAWVPENIRSGIMSNVAWTYLKPYLRDPMELSLSRVN